jgi:hypothetical protein
MNAKIIKPLEGYLGHLKLTLEDYVLKQTATKVTPVDLETESTAIVS